jgi:tetratricopeptide (TPR) repeat protein
LRIIFKIIFIVFLFYSCDNSVKVIEETVQSNNVPSNNTNQQSQKKDTVILNCNEYKKLAFKSDSILLNAVEINTTAANKAIKDFTNFSYYCHTDSLAPIYLIKTAQVARSINNFKQAQVVLERCIGNYPLFKDKPAAMFLLAQLFDDANELNNEIQAEQLYQEIIQDYPKSSWAKNAKGALKFLGKSDEEIIKELNKK